MKQIFLYLLFFLLGAGALFSYQKLSSKFKSKIESESETRERHLGQMQFINPLLDCPTSTTAPPPKQNELQEAVETKIDELVKVKQITEAAVYFRDLNNGPSFGINHNTLFSSASLLKVPLMVGYLKAAENKPELLKESAKYNPELHDSKLRRQNFPPEGIMTPGADYSINDLLNRLIIESDNRAAHMLSMHRPDIDIVKVLEDMGIKMTFDVVNNTVVDSRISVRNYATIFRILYNATYLNDHFSNLSLILLTKTKMRGGLQAGLPENVLVAHKFGERGDEATSQFHDCGIVYFEPRPYLICIMTRGDGTNFTPLVKAVATISKIVFEKVSDVDYK